MCSCLFGLESSEVVNFDVLNERVELLLGLLFFVAHTRNTDADLSGDVSDSVNPDSSVEAGVDSHLLQQNQTLQ